MIETLSDQDSSRKSHGPAGDLRGTMHSARALALNLLFQVDVGKLTLEEAVAAAEEHAKVSIGALASAIELASGALEYAPEADAIISGLAQEWPVDRQPSVDRNILRLALYEMEHRPDTPVAVVMDEAVELAKMYSTEDSGKFVNGVLAAALRGKTAGKGSEEGECGDSGRAADIP